LERWNVRTLERSTWLLEVDHLHKWYTDREAGDTPALTDVSFQVTEGEFVSIVGPSGIGKTTLLKMIAGLEPPSQGEIRLRGRPVTGPPPEMILVFQDYTRSLLPWRTVLRNVTFGLEFRHRNGRREWTDRAREVLAMAGLAPFEDYYPWQLSGGMQQRVAIARALACQPAILLMDEPFGSLDALTRADLEDHLLRLWAALGLTVLFVTHDMDEAIYLSDRVLVLQAGQKAEGRKQKAAGGKQGAVGEPEGLGAWPVGSIQVELPRPRDQLSTREDPAFLACRHRLHELMGRLKVGG
jgi:NitT/TauT family transport system ATP-binding protein